MSDLSFRKLDEGDRIVTAYAQNADGPGWQNCPVWIVIRARDGTFREMCLQPEEQSLAMRIFYRIASEIHVMMTKEAQKILGG